MQTLLQSDENYYNSKRSNNQSFQNFIRILIVAFLGAFIAKTPWNSLQVPVLAYAGAVLLIVSMLLTIYTYPIAQKALEEYREATHKTFNENNIKYIDEMPRTYKKLNKLQRLLEICLALSIVICPVSYITEKTLEPKEVTQMAKKQQSTQQPSKKVGSREDRSWDTPSRPITPTPAGTPIQPTQPTQPQPTQPTQPQPTQPQPTQPEAKPQPSPKKD